MFGTKPNVEPHVNYMLSKVRKKLWTLRHLKRAGMSSADLLKVFNCIIRPVLEYAASTYHSMLTIEQSTEIERVQKRACKLIFGWDSSYNSLVENGTIVTLKDRREQIALKFAKKTAENERFRDKWFPRREYGFTGLRNEMKYEEKFAKTERLKKSPIFYMRREMNKSQS